MNAELIKVAAHTPEWHAVRKTGIGGSDCAAALGLSKWKTPYQLWCEKVGEAEPQDETWEMLRGKAMEPALRQQYSNETGRDVRLHEGILRHHKHSFMLYSPDGFTDNPRLVELKTATYSKDWGDIGSDEVPQEYLLQVQHGMIVTGMPVADVYPSIGGGKPKLYEIRADNELQEIIIDRLYDFWRRVEQGIPPDPINSDDLAMMYKVVHKSPVIATPEIIELIQELKALRNVIKRADEEKERLEFSIKQFMADKETLLDCNSAPLITWRQAKGAERLDGKALKEDKPLIYEEYMVTSEPIRRFLVK